MPHTQDIMTRLQAIEDELAIRNLLTRYGLAVDCGDADTAAALHTADCVYAVAAPGSGSEAAQELLKEDIAGWQALG